MKHMCWEGEYPELVQDFHSLREMGGLDPYRYHLHYLRTSNLMNLTMQQDWGVQMIQLS